MLNIWENLCKSFTPERLTNTLRLVVPNYRPMEGSLDSFITDNSFDNAVQIGVIEISGTQTVVVGTVRVKDELTARSGKRKQYDFIKDILRHSNHNAGIFAFYDNVGRFRFSLVTINYQGTQRLYSTFRRYTFFIDPELPNKTFLQQMQRANFSDLSGILETFSIEAVSDEFYKDFKDRFDDLAAAVQGTDELSLKDDLALLFVIRIIFLGFVQKKGWLGNNSKFMQHFWEEYRQSGSTDTFYRDWLEPLFFEALSSPPGRKVAYGRAPFSTETQKALQMAPYLNGELFKRKKNLDDLGLWVPDEPIDKFFDFLFQYNFTVEENELYDEELELNPEFLGIIFERITNKEQGAVYTPREEVDLMCRLSLVKWLEQTTGIGKTDLYRLFFREAGTGETYDEYQKQGDFSPKEIRSLIERLESVTVCDPAAGSGAFEVGMLQVLDQVLENLYSRNNTPDDLKNGAPSHFERKKAIIAHSLYGVEVKRWAVWINHMRLWLTLFVDMPDEDKTSCEPLLPNLTFKVRTGDSLVQRIGGNTFPVKGYVNLPQGLKRRITHLKQMKHDFFYNKSQNYRLIEHEETAIFRDVLNEEINQRQERIRILNQSKHKQQTFLETSTEQTELDFKIEIERLNAEIGELIEQKRNLKDERPFIWSIEFSEIFFEHGGFDIIIGNPPYLRQEDISDPNCHLDSQAYKEALLEMLRIDFPDYFALSEWQVGQFREGRRPSGRSDLYTYFYIRSLRLLNRKGIHVFICSNSWLDVDYGTWLQEFFLRQAPLYFVIDNHARRSFVRADINTIITVTGAPGRVKKDHTVKFVAFKQPFENVVLSDNMLAIEHAEKIIKNDSFRVSPLTVSELLEEGSEIIQESSDLNNYSMLSKNVGRLGKYLGDKWGGKYLRAPDIFFTILEKGKDKLIRLGDIAEVRFGIKTGANEFFYLEPLCPGSRPGLLRVRNGAGWEGEIEEEFLKPVIKSPRECRSIIINPEDMRYRIFMCHKDKTELKGTRALKYIEWGEEQEYHLRPTLLNRNRWWDLGERDLSGLHFNYLIHDVGRTFVGHLYFSDNFHDVYLGKDYAVSLNSTVFFLFQNVIGRTNFGGGLMKIQTYELERMKLINIRTNESKEILNNKHLTIFQECGINPESGIPIADQEPNPVTYRKALDDIVFNALGLTEGERKEVYRAVCQLVWERISKARSVGRNG